MRYSITDVGARTLAVAMFVLGVCATAHAQSSDTSQATQLHKLMYLFERKVEAQYARSTVYTWNGTTEHEPESTQALPLSDCDYLRIHGVGYDGEGSYQKAYDTTRLFIERCYDQRPTSGWLSIFMKIGGAASGLASTNNDIWLDFREWLKKVLYYNRDTEYYCADVSELFSTFQASTSEDLSEFQAATARVAVMTYILNSHKCPKLDADFQNLIDAQNEHRRSAWEDSLRSWQIDPSTRSYDSSLPNIDDLGLSLLRGNPNAVSSQEAKSGPSLVSAAALNNPFKQSLDVTVEMGRQALVSVEMFDVLGNNVPLHEMKYLLKDEGTQRITVPTGTIASGTYYLRVSTDWGDVKTIKVVKE